MAGTHVVHQIELRWQPDKDFSAVAGSFDDPDLVRLWSARLARTARPDTPDADAGVPDRNAVYQVISDGVAALIWRHYQADALPLYEQEARRPLVARALIGATSVLRPRRGARLVP